MSSVVSVKRMGGAPDHASRSKVFGPDANVDTLVCGACQYGEKEDWAPTMKKSQCPACGNREGHEVRGAGGPAGVAKKTGGEAETMEKAASPTHINIFFTLESIKAGALADALNKGCELVCMVPFKMVPGDGGTVVQEYLVTLRSPNINIDDIIKKSR
jgi:hypothetical protein